MAAEIGSLLIRLTFQHQCLSQTQDAPHLPWDHLWESTPWRPSFWSVVGLGSSLWEAPEGSAVLPESLYEYLWMGLQITSRTLGE